MSEVIKLSSDIQNHWLWTDPVRLKWWLDLLFMASPHDRKVCHDSHVFTLHRGQLIASVRTLMKRWKVGSHHTIDAFIYQLIAENMISRAVKYRSTSVVTITVYDAYVDKPENKAVPTLVPTLKPTLVPTLNDGLSACKSDGSSTAEEDTVPTLVPTLKPTLVPTLSPSSTAVPTLNSGLSVCKSDGSSTAEEDTVPTQMHTQKTASRARNSNDNNISSLRSDIYINRDVVNTTSLSGRGPDEESENFSSVVDVWNRKVEEEKAVVAKVRLLRGKRAGSVRARLRECGMPAFTDAVTRLMRSSYLNGHNPHGWIATFDWFVSPSNFAKVLEGNYDNRTPSPPPPESAEADRQEAAAKRKRDKQASITPTDYQRWKREHPEEFRRQQERLARGELLTEDENGPGT